MVKCQIFKQEGKKKTYRCRWLRWCLGFFGVAVNRYVHHHREAPQGHLHSCWRHTCQKKKRIILSFPIEPFVFLLASRWAFMSKRSFAEKLLSLQTCCVMRHLSHHGTIKLTIAWHPLAVYEDGIIATTPIALWTPVWKPRDRFHGHLDLPVPFETRRLVVLEGKQWLGRECKLWPNTRPPTGNDWLQ